MLVSACPVSPSRHSCHIKPLLFLREEEVDGWLEIRSVQFLECLPHGRGLLRWI